MYAKHREAFLLDAVRHGLSDRDARALTRLAATHHRLAEAACTGDWPCDNGERPVVECPRCGGCMVRSKVVKGVCEDCRVEDKARAIVAEYPGVTVEFQGDPRGWTMALRRR